MKRFGFSAILLCLCGGLLTISCEYAHRKAPVGSDSAVANKQDVLQLVLPIGHTDSGRSTIFSPDGQDVPQLVLPIGHTGDHFKPVASLM